MSTHRPLVKTALFYRNFEVKGFDIIIFSLEKTFLNASTGEYWRLKLLPTEAFDFVRFLT